MSPIIRASIVGLWCWILSSKLRLSLAVTISDYNLSLENSTNDTSADFFGNIVSCISPALENGRVDDEKENFTVGDRITIMCNEGYRFQHIRLRTMVVVCQPDGIWKDVVEMTTIPICEKIGGCSLPPSLDNGYVESKDGGFMSGDVVPVRCHTGFSLYPPDAIPLLTCSSGGHWHQVNSLSNFKCKAVEDCLGPPDITNGFFQLISPNGSLSGTQVRAGTRAVYHCMNGFMLMFNSSAVLTCVDGSWNGEVPTCKPKQTTDTCSSPPTVTRAQPYLSNASLIEGTTKFVHGTKVFYVCDYGFIQQGTSTVTCSEGEWIGSGPKCISDGNNCPTPQALTHGDYSLYGNGAVSTGADGTVPSGSRAFYYCTSGYKMKESNGSVLICSGGRWTGIVSSCVKRTNCDVPMDIENGNWILRSYFTDFRIGVIVTYACDEGYKAVGTTEVTCKAPGYWSDYGPKCVPIGLYCSEPHSPLDGFYMCKPSHCDFFRTGTEVHYVCNKGFELHPSDATVQTCLPGGEWSGGSQPPVCLLYESADTTAVYSLKANSVTVVVTTASGVLGLLLAVMITIALRRHLRRRGRLCPPAPGPPSHLGSSNQHLGNSDEQDREALISYVDFTSVTPPILPTYEEAMSSRRSTSRSPAANSWTSNLSMRVPHRDYRILPGSRMTASASPFIRDAMESTAQNRNSATVTVSNMTRGGVGGVIGDNSSIVYGSVDTVNVSDGTSTSVTVDTCDSMASNPSIATSHHATAGSIDSYSANELPSGEFGVERRDSESHPPPNCGTPVTMLTERFLAEPLRAIGESTPILEVPEESKDDGDDGGE